MNMIAAPQRPAAKPVERILTVEDRCDLCQSQAYVKVLFGKSELLFCGHHYAEMASNLTLKGGLVLVDERDFINAPYDAAHN